MILKLEIYTYSGNKMGTTTTPNLKMPNLDHREVNGDVTHNESLQIMDMHGQSIVEAVQTAEPGSPSDGQAWIINGTPTGSNWGSDASANQVAQYYGGVWYYYTPQQGWRFYSKADDLIHIFTGIAWIIYIAGDNPPNQTWQAFQDYGTPLSTGSLAAGSFHDIVIAGNGQVGTEFSYNDTTGELTYSGINAVFECSFTVNLGGVGVGNNQNYSFRIYDAPNIEVVVLGGVYVTSNAVNAITVSGSLLYTRANGDIIKLQMQPSNTGSFEITGGWFVHKMYNI